MGKFKVHDEHSAPGAARALLQKAKEKFGFVPNVLGVLAKSPPTLEAYLSLSELVEQSAFSPVEQQVVILAVSRANACEYCVAAHSTIADMVKVPGEVTEAIRAGESIDDKQLQALRHFAEAAVEKRGWLDQQDLQAFEAGGYEHRHVLEVFLIIALKTLSNYSNHVAKTPLDRQFEARAWAE